MTCAGGTKRTGAASAPLRTSGMPDTRRPYPKAVPYSIGDVVDIETDGFSGTVELTDVNDDRTFEAVFYPEGTVLKVSPGDITGFACP